MASWSRSPIPAWAMEFVYGLSLSLILIRLNDQWKLQPQQQTAIESFVLLLQYPAASGIGINPAAASSECGANLRIE